MFKLTTYVSTAMMSLILISLSLMASEDTVTPSSQPPLQPEPTVKSTIYTPDQILASPTLKTLQPFEKDCNKIIFKFETFPKQEKIIVDVKRLGGNSPDQFQNIGSFTIQEDDTFVDALKKRSKIFSLSSKDFFLGERVTYRFHTTDNTLNKEVTGIPNPAVFKDKTGTVQLFAELVSISPTVYFVDMPTLHDGDKFKIRTVVVGLITKANAVYDSKVPYHFAPSVKKVKGGESHFEITTSKNETYFLKLPWGAALDSHPGNKKTYLPKD